LSVHSVKDHNHWDSGLSYFGKSGGEQYNVLVRDKFSIDFKKVSTSKTTIILTYLKYLISIPVDIALFPVYAVIPFFIRPY
jgi:hypothetical protein